MHFKNGRVAKVGDKVMVFPPNGTPYVGILYDAIAGNDYCNGRIAPIHSNDACPNLQECLHLDDVKAKVGNIADVDVQPGALETRHYTDGTSATGTAPLPAQSPAQQGTAG